jgi:putative ABC transport system ATP-binding protein
MVTHEPDVAARCQRTVVMRDGLIVSDTPNEPQEAQTPQQEPTQV